MCDYPMMALRLGVDPDTGKQRIKFLTHLDLSYKEARFKYGDALLMLPCGKCPSCSKAYSKTWSVRLMLESYFYEHSIFVTLTYSSENLPKDGKINKKHVQDFMKRLRFHFDGQRISYFACGEYGSDKNTKRPHYHIILFGVDFDDKEYIFSNKLQQKYYRSKTLDKLWSHGLVSFSEVTPDSCAYTARYSMKKKLNMSQDDYFLLMSRRPAIGYYWFEYKKDVIYLSDKIYSGDFHGVSIPRFFDKLAEKDPEINSIYQRVKEARIKRVQLQQFNFMIMNNCKSMEQAQLLQLENSVRAMSTIKRR